MSDLSDHELRARFAALRATEERNAPAFDAVVGRVQRAAPIGPRIQPRWRVPLALVVAAALLLGVGLMRTARRRAFVPQPLSAWTSPTESLLYTPTSAVLAWPTLAPSALDHLTSMLAQSEGK
jgi:hypothetical protein